MAIVTTTLGADGVALITLDDPTRPANVTCSRATAVMARRTGRRRVLAASR